REPRPSPARSGLRPRREPLAGVPARDATAQSAGSDRGLPLCLHPYRRRIRDAVARRWNVGLHVRKPDLGPVLDRLPRLGDGLGARAVPAPRRRCAHCGLCPLSSGAAGASKLMDVALSPNGKRVLRVFFGLLVVFLYAPILLLLIFSLH